MSGRRMHDVKSTKKNFKKILLSWIVGPQLHQSPICFQMAGTDRYMHPSPYLHWFCLLEQKRDSVLAFYVNQEQSSGASENAHSSFIFAHELNHMDLTFVNSIGKWNPGCLSDTVNPSSSLSPPVLLGQQGASMPSLRSPWGCQNANWFHKKLCLSMWFHWVTMLNSKHMSVPVGLYVAQWKPTHACQLWEHPSPGAVDPKDCCHPAGDLSLFKGQAVTTGTGLSSWEQVLIGTMARASDRFSHSVWDLQEKPHVVSWEPIGYRYYLSFTMKTMQIQRGYSLTHGHCHLFPNLFQKKSAYRVTRTVK